MRTPEDQHRILVTFLNVPWFTFQEQSQFVLQFAIESEGPVRSPGTLSFIGPCDNEDSPLRSLVLPKLDGQRMRDAPPTALDMAEVMANTPTGGQCSELSRARTAVELAHATMFMSSNNRLLWIETNKFVKSIVDSNMRWVLKTILATKSLTTEILATNFLIVACQYDDLRTVSLLISLGADVNVRKSFPEHYWSHGAVAMTALMSPLGMAIRNGRLAVVKKLIEAGAKINSCPDDHLMVALASPDTNKMVRLLLEQGADVERSPILTFAAASDAISLTKILLDAGAFNGRWSGPRSAEFPNLPCAYEERTEIHYPTPLQVAAERNNLVIVHALIGGASDVNGPSTVFNEPQILDKRFKCSQTAYISPLVHAVRNGNVEMIKALLTAGADVNFRADHGSRRALRQVIVELGESNEGESHRFKERFLRHITNTALQTAACQENLEVVQLLLEAGALVDTYEYGDTALQTAVKRNNAHLTQLLLAHGANIHAPTHWPFGRTALQAASENGNVALLQLLLSTIANISWPMSINAPPSPIGGRTAIQAAAGNGHVEMVQYLLRLGADINGPIAEEHGATAAQAAARSRNPSMAALVLVAGASHDTSACTNSALAIAIGQNDLPMFELLLQYAADICYHTAEYDRPILQVAAGHKSTIFLDRLIGKGFDVNESWEDGSQRTALQRAVAEGHFDAAKLLLQAGADASAPAQSWEAPDDWAPSALLDAVYRKRYDLIKLLLQYGADPNVVHGPYDYTALAEAVDLYCFLGGKEETDLYAEEDVDQIGYQHNEELGTMTWNIIMLLLQSGANADCRAEKQNWLDENDDDDDDDDDDVEYNCSILASAAESGLIDIVKLLLTAGANPNWRYGLDDATALERAISKGFNATIDLLLESGADINAPAHSKYGMTALQRAISKQNFNCIRNLLQKGADVNASPGRYHGVTALQEAVEVENDEIVHLIIEAGADINAPTSPVGGRTALQQAASQGNLEYVRMLLQKGADVNAPPSGKKGVTALQAASISGYLAVAILLLHEGANINAQASQFEGRTALEGAAEHGRLDIVHLLLENDHEIEGFYDRCKGAALLAENEGHTTIARLLREYEKDEAHWRMVTPMATLSSFS